MRRSTTADQIKDLILTSDLRPGDPLPTEAELCERLSVSRSSVREAIRALAALDIVEVRHGHGTFVGRMSLDAMVQALVFRGALSAGDGLRALREVAEIRQLLDLAMAEQVVTALSTTKHPGLGQLVAKMAGKAVRDETFVEDDRAFHTQLSASFGNHLAGQLVGALWDAHHSVLSRLGLALPEDVEVTARAHRDMLDAAEAGDVAAYRRAVLAHYEPLQRALDRAG